MEPYPRRWRLMGMYRGLSVAAVLLVTACVGNGTPVAPSSSTSITSTSVPAPSSTSTSVTTSTTVPVTQPSSAEVAWSEAEAEQHVANYLAALAAGAFEQAGFSVDNNGIEVPGQANDETFAEFLQRMCSGGVCAGPYDVSAVGPGVIDSQSQASSEVTVVHTPSGTEGTIRLATFEGQLVIADLPPLVASEGGPTLVETLFGADPPHRVVVQRFNAFEIWENGSQEWVTNWFADEAFQIEGEIVAVSIQSQGTTGAVELRDPHVTYQVDCVQLMERGGEVLALDQCATDRWRLIEVRSGEEREAAIDFESRTDGEHLWFDERGGTVVHGASDAEGNLIELVNLDGVDLAGDSYPGLSSLSTDGKLLAFVDHADPAAHSHFWSPVVVVVATGTGEEIGRWTLEHPALCLEFAEDWLVACEVDDVTSLDPHPQALTAIHIVTGDINRVETRTRIFLPG